MPRQAHTKMVKYHLPQLEAESNPSLKAGYLAALMSSEGFEPAAAVLAAYCRRQRDGLLIYTYLLQVEQAYESNISDLLESFANFFQEAS